MFGPANARTMASFCSTSNALNMGDRVRVFRNTVVNWNSLFSVTVRGLIKEVAAKQPTSGDLGTMDSCERISFSLFGSKDSADTAGRRIMARALLTIGCFGAAVRDSFSFLKEVDSVLMMEDYWKEDCHEVRGIVDSVHFIVVAVRVGCFILLRLTTMCRA